ncbi:MAG: PAS domain-containing protein [Parcubacteria group bacterium Licking1014_1]|nr:MAG: PAS domain-containing protein [Parcubacteria group bacterium Licking1014_1]
MTNIISLQTINLTDVLQSIPDGIILIAPNRSVLFANATASRLTGLPQQGFYLAELDRLLKTKAPINLEDTITTVFTDGTSAHFSDVQVAAFFYEFFITPCYDAVQKVIGGIIVMHDVTDRVELDHAKNDFLSLASHQLRTPLSGTKWLIETMQKGITGKIEKKEKEYLDQIYQVNERMIQLVSEMLGVLRLESETGPIKKEVVLISSLYKDISISMMAASKSRKIILHSTLKDHKLATVETNQEILKSILECFISNAINYSQDGQEVVLDAKEEPTAVVFSVKDGGIGIPEEEQKKIFERFYRASNAKNFKPGGSGLGLSIAKMLAEKIGADISFKSPSSAPDFAKATTGKQATAGKKENKGTTFFLRIPKK